MNNAPVNTLPPTSELISAPGSEPVLKVEAPEQRSARPGRGLWALWRSASARRGFLGVLDQAANSIASFATVVILGRCASQHELGVYSLALTPLLLLTNMQAELITAPYTVYRQRHRGPGLAEYNGSILIHQVVFATLCSLGLLLGFVFLWNRETASELTTPLLVLSLAAPCWLMRAFIRYVSFANLQFASAVVVDGLAAALQVCGLLICTTWMGLYASSAFLVLGGASAIACAYWWTARRTLPFRPRRTHVLRDWRRNWCFARWALASQLIGCSTPFILPWVVAHTRGEAAAGLLAASVNLCGLAMLLVVGVAHSLTPQAARAFAEGGVGALRQMLARTMLFFTLSLGSFWVGAMLFGEAVMVAVYGPQFSGTGLVVSLLAASVLATSFAVAGGNGLWAVERPQANLVADAVTLLVTLVTALLLVGSAGVVGAAAATLCGNASGALTRLLILRWVLAGVEGAELLERPLEPCR